MAYQIQVDSAGGDFSNPFINHIEKDFVSVVSGGDHTLALKNDGTVWAWGVNNSAQLGDGTLIDRHFPVQLSNLNSIIALAAGTSHSLALKNDGTVWVWGTGSF